MIVGLKLCHYFINRNFESTCQQARSVSDWPSCPPSIMKTHPCNIHVLHFSTPVKMVNNFI